MGRPKPLLPLGDKPVVRYCLDAIFASGVKDVVVVIGSDRAGILEAVRRYPLTIAVNSNPTSQMVESVMTGLRATDSRSSGVLVCLADHPLVLAETIQVLIRVYTDGPGKIVLPVYEGKRGHPTLFPRSVIEETALGLTLREIIRKDPGRVRTIEVCDQGVVLDTDTVEDYEQIRRIAAGRHR